MKYRTLGKNTKMPMLGFGTWRLAGRVAFESVKHALAVGYRHIDTAAIYGNHQEVGRAIAQSGIARKEIFITSKVWRDKLRYSDVRAACRQALSELQIEYLDLYLIHWPNRSIPMVETLSALDSLKKDGFIKAIGVSNFDISHLKEALATGLKIVTNQVEFHPSFNQKELKKFCDEHHIVITAYSPIGQGKDLELTVVKNIAKKYKRSPSQVILNWLISKHIIAIPRSSHVSRIADNFKALEWEMSQEDVERIDSITIHERILHPPFAEFE